MGEVGRTLLLAVVLFGAAVLAFGIVYTLTHG